MNLTEEHKLASCVHSNFSCLEGFPTATDVLLYIFVVVIVTETVSGNLLVIITICHFKELQTPTNFLLLSLATADFLVGVIVIPTTATVMLDPQRCFGKLFCTFLDVTAFFLTFLSIYNVALIAVDRYFALSNPFLYSMKMTVNVTLRVIAILWLSSAIYNLVLVYINIDNTDMKENVTCGKCMFTLNTASTVVDFIVVFALPCSMIIILYLRIFVIAEKHAKKIRSLRNSKETNGSLMASERKAAKKLGILVGVFLLCLVPYYVSSFVDGLLEDGSFHMVVSSTMTLMYLNSSINPIIYALVYPWFQKSAKLIITLKICRTEYSNLNVLVHEI